MRKVLLSMLAAAFLLSLVGPALALPILPATDPPAWWDNPDRQRNDTVTVTNTGGSGLSEGTLTVFLDNLNDRTKYKEVYLVVESEIVFFSYSGIEVAEQLVIEYDLRTKCFEHENGNIPEPSGLALLALGAVGLARRKRS